MYQLTNPIHESQEAQCIKRLSDSAYIPKDPANTDYQGYLAWLAEGNAPTPADPVQPDPNAG